MVVRRPCGRGNDVVSRRRDETSASLCLALTLALSTTPRLMALTRKVAQATTVLLARHGRLAHQPYRRLHASTSRLGPESNPVLSEDGALKVPSDTTITTALTTEPREGWLYIDSVFPTRLAQWEYVPLPSLELSVELHS